MFHKIAPLATLLTLMLASSTFAQCDMCKKASSSNANWPERSFAQLVQGAANITMGWTKAFTEPFKENQSNPNPDTGYKFGNGVLMGWGKACMATGAGILEGVTFWTPVRIIPNTDCPVCQDVAPAVSSVTGNLSVFE